MCFSKDTFGLIGVHKQVDCVHFEPMLSNLAPLKADRALKMGWFGTTNGSKTGQNHGFPVLTGPDYDFFYYDFTAFFYDFVTMLREHSLPYRPMFSLIFKPKNWQ